MNNVSLTQASTILQHAVARARELNLRPMGVVILDATGAVTTLAREDGAGDLRLDIAKAKAWGAVQMGASSRALGERAKNNPTFYAALPALSQGRMIAHTGAVLILDAAGQTLGAVGASGDTGDNDEAICIAGIEAAGLRHG